VGIGLVCVGMLGGRGWGFKDWVLVGKCIFWFDGSGGWGGMGGGGGILWGFWVPRFYFFDEQTEEKRRGVEQKTEQRERSIHQEAKRDVCGKKG